MLLNVIIFSIVAARYYFTSEPLKSLSFEIGTDVVLSCEVSDEYGVQWFKNEIEIQSNKKYNLRNNGLVHKLAILNAQPEDAGDYVCKCCYDRTECIIKAGTFILHPLQEKFVYIYS